MFPLLAKAASSVNDMDGVSGLSSLFVARETLAGLECAADRWCVDAAAIGKLLEKMGEVPAVREASVAFRHLLCSSSTQKPTPPPPPPPPPPPTNRRNLNLGDNWSNPEHVATGTGQG